MVEAIAKLIRIHALAYGEVAMANDDHLRQVSVGLQSAPYIANAASNVALEVDKILPFGSFWWSDNNI